MQGLIKGSSQYYNEKEHFKMSPPPIQAYF